MKLSAPCWMSKGASSFQNSDDLHAGGTGWSESTAKACAFGLVGVGIVADGWCFLKIDNV